MEITIVQAVLIGLWTGVCLSGMLLGIYTNRCLIMATGVGLNFRRSADRTGNGGSRRAGIYGIRSISGRKCTAEPDGAWNHRKYYGDHNERRRSRCCDSPCIIVPVCGCIPVCNHTCLHSNGRCQRHSDKSAGKQTV